MTKIRSIVQSIVEVPSGVVVYYAMVDEDGGAWWWDTKQPKFEWQPLPPHPGNAPTSGQAP